MTTKALSIPTHIGFIMDGNRRWAQSRNLPIYKGHMAGYETARTIAEACFRRGVKFVTLYVFSTENWQREVSEVSYIMKLVAKATSAQEVQYSLKKGSRMLFLGHRDTMDPALVTSMEKTERATKDQKNGTICVCLNYGGQQEIADAAKQCMADGLSADEITPDAISARVYWPEVPPVDLVVRTSGEQRLSNFMLWRIEYSELLFLEKHWPDMTKDDVDAIIETYDRRSRRFGG